jgi:hypothetical protein
MPIATDSGYLPDWLAALIGQGGAATNAPAGLFSDTAASPAPNVGLLSNSPIFTGVRTDAPAFQGGNAPNGPLPDQSPTFSYMSQTPPWGGSGPSNSYPSMTMPQDPGPMNIGPGGAAPSFTGVSPNAPFTANGPSSVQDQYANVPLPPRRPNDPTSFQATADPQDINTPPLGRPNANVVGTAASGAPEVTAQQSLGLGDYLGKAANAIGGIYGAGGPGDALIALGLSNRTGGASIQALNSMNANRASQANVALKQLDYANKLKATNSSYDYLIRQGVDPATARAATEQAAVGNTDPLKTLFNQYSGTDQYTIHTGPDGNAFAVSKYDPTKVTPVGPQTGSSQLADIPIGKNSEGQDQFVKGWVQKGQPLSSAVPVGAPFTKQPEIAFQGEGAESKAIGEAKGKGVADALGAAQTAPKRIQAVDIIDEASRAGKGNISSGPAADRILQGKQLLNNAFGWDFGNSVAPSEVISKTGYGLAAELARTINSQRGGTQGEFFRGLQNVPGLLVSDEGRKALTDIIRQGAKQDLELGKLADRYDSKRDGPWTDVVQKFYEDNPLKSPFSGKPLGQEDADRLNAIGGGGGQSAAAAPAAGPMKVRTYNPKTGQWDG